MKNSSISCINSNGICKIDKYRINIIILCIVYCMLILSLRFNSYLCLIVFAINLVVFIFLPTDLIFCDLFFLLPFASIYKFSAEYFSLFTLLEVCVCFLLFIREKQIDIKVLISILLFLAYLILSTIFYNSLAIIEIAQQVINILLLYFFVSKKNNMFYKQLILFYASGLVASSVIALFADYFPQFYELVNCVEGYVDGILRIRFSGLYSDPNYYSVNIILALAGIILLYYRKEVQVVFWLLFLLLSILGVFTYSKSFVLMYVGVCIMLIYVCIKNKQVLVPILFALAMVVVLFLGGIGKIKIVHSLLERLFTFHDLNSLTTGRFQIWLNYLSYFANNLINLFLGNGLDADYVSMRAPHNTYIDLLYNLGIIGTLFYFSCIICCLSGRDNKTKKSILNYSGLIVVLVMYFFLSMLNYYDMIFHIMIIKLYYDFNLVVKL